VDEALWALGRGTGIVALGFLTVSVALGIGTRSGRPMFTLPRFAVADVHRFASLAGTVLVFLHVALLLGDPYAQLRLVDTVLPFLGVDDSLWLGFGTVAVDLLVAVALTGMLRHRIGFRAFRLVHWAAYGLWPVAFAHALGTGTDAGRWWFLAFAAACALAVATMVGWRLQSTFVEYQCVRIPVRQR
jgi:methionine sulfoxide reductase heme-binding subunit